MAVRPESRFWRLEVGAPEVVREGTEWSAMSSMREVVGEGIEKVAL